MSDPLGYIVWWDLKKSLLTKSKFSEAQRTLNISTSSRSFLTKRAALKRTIGDFKTFLAKKENSEKYIFDKIVNLDRITCIITVLERTPRARKAKIRQTLRIKYRAGEITYRSRKTHPLFIKFNELYEYNKEIFSYLELSRVMVTELVSHGSVILHPKGRIYFVPYAAKPIIERLKSFVGIMDGEKHFWAIPQADGLEIRSAITASLNRYLDQKRIFFDRYDRKPSLTRRDHVAHLLYCTRGKDVLEYYIQKLGIDLTGKIGILYDRIEKFQKGVGS